MKIEVISKEKQNIISISKNVTVEEIPNVIGPSFMKMGRYIQDQKAIIQGPPFVAYKNISEEGVLDENNIDLEVGFPIDKEIPIKDEMKYYVSHSYNAVSTLYIGKYEDMVETYDKLREKIVNLDKKFTGISYEYYLTGEDVPMDKQETIIELVFE